MGFNIPGGGAQYTPQRSAPALLNPGPAPSHYIPSAPQHSAPALLNPAHVYQPPAHYSAPAAAPQHSATALLNPGSGGSHSAPGHSAAPNVARLVAVLAQLNSTKSGRELISQMQRWIPGLGANPFTGAPNHDTLNPFKTGAPLDYGHPDIPSDPFRMPKGLDTISGKLPQYDAVPNAMVPDSHVTGIPRFPYQSKGAKGGPFYPIQPAWNRTGNA